MQIFLALLLTSITLALVYLRYLMGYWRRRGIPHDEPNFPMGNMQGWRKTKHFIELFQPVYEKYKGSGPFCGFYFMLRPTVMALDLDLVKHVLIKDFNNFDDRGVFHNQRDDLLSGNLFQLDSQTWRPLRHKLSPTFTSGKMKTMLPMVLKVADELTSVFDEKVLAAGKGTVEITDLLGRFTADVIGSCAFGLDCNSLRNPNAEFVVMGRASIVKRNHNKLIDSFIEAFPDIARKLRMRQGHKDIANFYENIVRDTVDYREKHNVQRSDFMNMLIDMKNNKEISEKDRLTFDEIVAQAFIFFVAGFETSSTTMGFALLELAQNPAVQEKLRQEVNEVLERHKNEFSYECMQDMHYMVQVISETLRKYPILPQLMRQAKERYETSDPKYFIEAGTPVFIPVHSIHMDPNIYPEPDLFDPDRFTEEEIKKRPSCSWLPFGEGPRNCIGLRFGKMQACVGLAHLIKNYRFSVTDRTEIPSKIILSSVLIGPANGIHLRVEKV